MKLLKYLLISLLVYSFIRLLALPSPVMAAGEWVFDYPDCRKETDTDDAMCSGSYDAHVSNNLDAVFVEKGAGAVEGVTVAMGTYENDPEYAQRMNQRSAMAGLTNVAIALYRHKPADLALWINDTAINLGFKPKTAYAQGIGFSGLAPLLGIWKAFRNIAYFLVAIVMVVIGFMVMLRKKIDPKTVVTVQNALPRIVITLLLITFSYAIAAFVIDLMYFVMALTINILINASGGILGGDTATKYLTKGLGTTVGALFWGGWSAIDDLVKLLFYNQDQTTALGTAAWWISLMADIVTSGSRWAFVWLIVTVALLFGLVRIVFMLISAYIQIIISILTAPLQLLFEAIPGSTSFSSWLKNLLAHVSVFPITAGMFLVGTILTQSNVERIWTPPLLTGGAGSRGVVGLIGLGILLTIPTVANSIKESLKAKPPVQAGPGAIFGPVGAGVGQAFQLGYQGMFIASPFLHKTPPSTPLSRSMEAIEGKIDTIAKRLGGGHGPA